MMLEALALAKLMLHSHQSWAEEAENVLDQCLLVCVFSKRNYSIIL